MKRLLCATAIALVLAGCASGGKTGQEVLTASISPSKSRIVFYRPSPLGFAIQPSYTIDGKEVAASQPMGFVVCEVAPGPHTVRAANLAGDANLSFSGSETAKINVAPGKTAYLRADIQPGLVIGAITLSQVTESQGRDDTSGLSQVQGNCA